MDQTMDLTEEGSTPVDELIPPAGSPEALAQQRRYEELQRQAHERQQQERQTHSYLEQEQQQMHASPQHHGFASPVPVSSSPPPMSQQAASMQHQLQQRQQVHQQQLAALQQQQARIAQHEASRSPPPSAGKSAAAPSAAARSPSLSQHRSAALSPSKQRTHSSPQAAAASTPAQAPTFAAASQAAMDEHMQRYHQMAMERDQRKMQIIMQQLASATAPAVQQRLQKKLSRLVDLSSRRAKALPGNSSFTSALQAASSAVAAAGGAAASSVIQAAAAAAAAPVAQAKDEADPDATNFQTDATSSIVFQGYVCKSLSFGVDHPCEVTEAGTLSGVDLPPAHYPIRESLPPHIIRDGLLSSLQLEGIVYSCQRHQHILHDGTRAGFFLADGAGVGKGRQIAGMLVDSFHRGNATKALWFSVSADLYLESKRDLSALGCKANVIKGIQAIDERCGKNWTARSLAHIPAIRDGVLYNTYSTLVSGMNAKKKAGGGGRAAANKSRIEQIVEWCGPDFEGLIIFDECHRAKNYQEGKEETSSLTGQAVVRLQAELPRARVVYASATGVTDIKNMAYFSRLGLWGKGSGFDSFKTFESSVSKRGIGAFELLAMELKNQGVYVSRGLSYASCSYIYVAADLDEVQESVYDSAAHFWLDLKRAYGEAMSRTGSPNSEWKIFWSTHQKFFGALCSSAKVHTIVEETQKALAEGYAVVIGLQSTGESSMKCAEAREERSKRHKGEGGAASAASASSSDAAEKQFPSLFREMLLRFLEEHFPVRQPQPKEPRKPRKRTSHGTPIADSGPAVVWGGAAAFVPASAQPESVPSSPGGSVIDLDDDAHQHNDEVAAPAAPAAAAAALPQVSTEPIDECVTLRDQFIERVSTLLLPVSPLDELIDLLGGPRKVSEMTGRSLRYVRSSGGAIKLEARGKGSGVSKEEATQDINVQERNLFMSGEKLIAIISDAASTGISLHADRAVKNQRARMHITLELPWSADKAIQQLGRTHRSNEVQGVLYSLVTSNLGGERRFSSACAARLQSLGALTKGDRRAATGSNLSQFDFDTKYGRQALKGMIDCISKDIPALDEQALADLQASGQQVLPDEEEAKELKELEARLTANPPSGDQLAAHESYLPHPYPWSRFNIPCWKICLDSLGMGLHDSATPTDVKRFLNRILGLPVKRQNALFELFVQCLNHIVLAAKKDGTFTEAVSDISSEHIRVTSRYTLSALIDITRREKESKAGGDAAATKGKYQHVKRDRFPENWEESKDDHHAGSSAAAASSSSHAAAAGSASGGSAAAGASSSDPGSGTYVIELELDRGISFEDAVKRLNEIDDDQKSAHTSFYLGTHPVTGAIMPLLAIRRPNSAFQFQTFRPNSGRSTAEMSKNALLNTYKRVSPQEIRREWTSLYDLTQNHCTHGKNCKIGDICKHGRRMQYIHILGGHVLSYLSELQQLAERYSHSLTVSERQLKVVRVVVDDGQRFVGLMVPKLVLDHWLELLVTGAKQVSAGLGVPAYAEPPKPAQAALISKYTGKPHTVANAPLFFAGSEEMMLHSNPAVQGDAAPAQPHQSTHLSGNISSASSQKHALPSLLTATPNLSPMRVSKPPASASAPERVSASKQTNLASFFGKAASKPASAAPMSGSSAASSSSAAVKQERNVPAAAAAAAAPSPPKPAAAAASSWRAASVPAAASASSSAFSTGRGGGRMGSRAGVVGVVFSSNVIDLISDSDSEISEASGSAFHRRASMPSRHTAADRARASAPSSPARASAAAGSGGGGFASPARLYAVPAAASSVAAASRADMPEGDDDFLEDDPMDDPEEAEAADDPPYDPMDDMPGLE